MTTKTLSVGPTATLQNGLGRHVGKLILVSDALAIIAACMLTLKIVLPVRAFLLGIGSGDLHAELTPQRTFQLYLFGAAICLGLAVKGHYAERQGFTAEAGTILAMTAGAALVDLYLQYSLGAQPSGLWLGATWMLVALLLIASRVAVKHALFQIGLWRCPVMLVGSMATSGAAHSFLGRDRYLGYVVADTMISDGTDAAQERLAAAVREQRCGYVLIVLDGDAPKAGLALARFVDEQLDVPYGIVPDLMGIAKGNLKIRKFFGQDLVVLDNDRSTRGIATSPIKRLLDVVAASLLLLFVAPLMLIIGLLIRLDGGSALYGSPRIGRGGQVFRALKFRSMVPKADQVLRQLLASDAALRAEWEAGYKLRHDPRITAIGHFIRRTSIDELPQLINVLRGEMSLVGPRPLLLDERPKYPGRDLELYERITPGLTGMWQVSGRNDLDYGRRIELNNWYIKNWSLWVDIVILIKTLFVVIRRSGAS